MGKIKVAAFSELEEGVGLRVDLTEHRVAIFLVDGTVFAIGDLCSHAEASLSEGEIFDTEVECPKHGSVFDLATGAPHSLPATKPVPVYQTTVEDGDIYLEIAE